MVNNWKSDNLTGKMVKRLLCGLAVGFFFIFVCCFGGRHFLKQYLTNSGFFYREELERAEELQALVTENHLSATDYDVLRQWGEERKLTEFLIVRDNLLLFDLTSAEDIYLGAKSIDFDGGRYYFTIYFADGEALVALDEGAAQIYYYVILLLSIVLGFAACLAVFIGGMQEDVRYIRLLEKEVNIIRVGDWSRAVSVRGSDELASLAMGLEQMRNSLNEKERIEKEMRAAQEKLVLGMAHDIRTPLTGVMTYMEILKRQIKGYQIDSDYLDTAYEKILQLRVLSDQMFEYFLIDSRKESELEEPEAASSVFNDYLSELCGLLESQGFRMNTNQVTWPPACVRVNTDYIGRIVNNLISNIGKYAEKTAEIVLSLDVSAEFVRLSVENTMAFPNQYVEGNGIGVNNITMMMTQMNGKAAVSISETKYQIELFFPIVDC